MHKWLPPWTARKQQKAEADRIERENARDRAVPIAINTLVDQIRAEREQQAAENDRKDSREKKTVLGLLATAGIALLALGVSIYQAYLTRVSITDSEKTSATQAADTQTALSIAKQEADAVTKQEDTLEAGSRAWIGIEQASSPAPDIGKDLQVTVRYVNTGRQPATNVQMYAKPFPFRAATTSEEKAASAAVYNFDSQCTGLTQIPVGVVYPTTGFSSYSYIVNVPGNQVDAAVLNGSKLLVVAGCFTYDTFQSVHYSYFCFYYQAKKSPPDSWMFCSLGNQAE